MIRTYNRIVYQYIVHFSSEENAVKHDYNQNNKYNSTLAKHRCHCPIVLIRKHWGNSVTIHRPVKLNVQFFQNLGVITVSAAFLRFLYCLINFLFYGLYLLC